MFPNDVFPNQRNLPSCHLMYKKHILSLDDIVIGNKAPKGPNPGHRLRRSLSDSAVVIRENGFAIYLLPPDQVAQAPRTDEAACPLLTSARGLFSSSKVSKACNAYQTNAIARVSVSVEVLTSSFPLINSFASEAAVVVFVSGTVTSYRTRGPCVSIRGATSVQRSDAIFVRMLISALSKASTNMFCKLLLIHS